MKKTIITVAVVVLVVAFGWLAYDLRKKAGKTPGAKGAAPLPPAATPPINLSGGAGTGTSVTSDGPAPGLYYTEFQSFFFWNCAGNQSPQKVNRQCVMPNCRPRSVASLPPLEALHLL